MSPIKKEGIYSDGNLCRDFKNPTYYKLKIIIALTFTVKGRVRGKYTPFFIGDIESSLKIWTNKKTHQKILIFDEVMACERSPFYGAL